MWASEGRVASDREERRRSLLAFVAALAAAATTMFLLAAATPAGSIEPEVCSGCKPPVTYKGGPVMSTTDAGVTITPIYWAPTGYAFSANYERIINEYIANVAAASGTNGNVFSIAEEYYQDIKDHKVQIRYQFHAGTPIVDTDAYPKNGCTPASGYTACLTDDQLRAELKHLKQSKRLATDLAHFYPVFFPARVETKDSDGTTSVDDFCAYHRAFGSGSDQMVYSDDPYNQSGGCNADQAPNGNVAADGAIDSFSHELFEALTDPLSPQYAWYDGDGNEAADMCGDDYGTPLGSTNPSDPGQTEYNQVINGGKYYTQSDFSNIAYKDFGFGKGCALSGAEALHQRSGAPAGKSSKSASNNGASSAAARNAGSSGVATPITVVNYITPTRLPADGTATAKVSLRVSDTAGNSVSNDPVHFTLGVKSGAGQCGTLSASDKSTNKDGNADITYTASRSNVACWVLGVEGHGGKPAEAVIYQGTTQKLAPTFTASYPTRIRAGGSTDFTIKATNPTSSPVFETRPHFVIFPGDGVTQNVNASQVHLSYSADGTKGTFTPVSLFGSTIKEGAIQGYVGPLQGVTLPADSTRTYTFHVALGSNVPVSQKRPLMVFDGYLDQIEPADGTAATLAETYASDVEVPGAASSDTLRNVLIGVGAAAVVVLGILGVILFRRRRNPPHQQPPQAATP